MLAYGDRYLAERLSCPAADGNDFVFVNLFHAPVGTPMTYSGGTEAGSEPAEGVTATQQRLYDLFGLDRAYALSR